MEIYTPAYFRKLADYYQHLAETAREYNVPKLLCNRLAEAGLQLRYAAAAIEVAKKRKR